MRRILREPLLHFLLLGVALLLGHAIVTPWLAAATYTPVVHISADAQHQLRQRWRDAHGRMPSASEFDALLKQAIDEELLLAQARRLGLHESDPVVRDRLVMNLHFANGESYAQPATLAEYRQLLNTAYDLGMAERDLVVRRRLLQRMRHEIQSSVSVSEAELKAWYAKHPAQFTGPAHYRISQLFFSAADSEARVRTAWRALQNGQPATGVDSDPFLLDGKLEWITLAQLRSDFGPALARAIETGTPGQWLAPVRSVYGVHLLRIEQVTPAQVVDYAQVRTRVAAAVYAQRDKAALREALAALRARAEIQIEPTDLQAAL